jgi:hypothetical protein
MAKKQTRRSISVSRITYERLKAFCESNNISMSQLVETRVNDFLGPGEIVAGGTAPNVGVIGTPSGLQPRPVVPQRPMASALPARPMEARPVSHASAVAPGAAAATAGAHPAHPPPQHPSASASASASAPMTSAAARFAVEPPLPIIKPRQDTVAPKPAEKRPEQIFTF